MNSKAFFSSFITKFIFLKRSFGDKPFRLLDVGAGNHSATKAMNVFPACEYYGLDLDRSYNNNEKDFNLMKGFYEMDLTKLNFSALPDDHFDGIWIVHVIEHLYNGDEVVQGLLPKLKKGGFMYIEYPGEKSTRLPSMYGTLNFNDDKTHVRVYSVKELTKQFEKNNCIVLKSGTRRNPWFMMATPFRIALSVVKGKKINGNIFWDVLGFAEYVWIRKK